MLENYGDVLTVNDIYEILPIGMNGVRRLLRDGTIKSIRVGNKYLIPKWALIDFINTTT